MIVSGFSLLLSALLWVMVLWRASSVRQAGASRSLWFVLLMFACAGTLYAVTPVGSEVRQLLAPVGGSAAAWMLCAIGAAAGGRSMAIYSGGPGPGRVHQLRINLAFGVIGAAGIVLSFILSPPVDPVFHAAEPELAWRAAFYVGTWQSVVRWAIWLAYLTADLVWLAALGYRQAGYAERVTLARLSLGLRIAAFGCRVGYAYVALKAVVVTGWLVGAGPSLLRLDQIADFASLIAVACVMTGVGYDAIVLGLGDARTAVSHARQLHQLGRFSRVLKAAAPESAGSIPAFGIRYRLSRRVIEIRDRQLALRAYIDRDAPTRALRASECAGYTGDEARAAAEAAWVAAACAAKERGHEPRVLLARAAESGGSNLEDEAAWLVKVANAHRRSRAVAAFACSEGKRGPVLAGGSTVMTTERADGDAVRVHSEAE